MSEAHETNEYDGPHEGPIKTPRQLIAAIVFSFVVPIFGIVLLVMYVTMQARPAAGTESLTDPMAIENRIKPVGMVEVKDSTDIASLKAGEQVFQAQCTACHAAGVLGAPKLGDVDAWAARIKTGYDTLLHSALAGKGQMPAQGGGDFTDFEIGRAVVYMANKAGGKLAEPTPPVAGASAPATITAASMAGPMTAAAPPPAATPLTAAASAATTVAVAATATPTPGAPAGAPPALYTQICGACHVAGVAGAPKFGDKAAWAPRIAQGIDTMTAHVIAGKGVMPPKGGSNASEAEIKAVVEYMAAAAR